MTGRNGLAPAAPSGRPAGARGALADPGNRRLLAGGLLAVVVAVVAWLVIAGGDEPYEVNIRFADGGQLVKGGLVEVAGAKIGAIQKVSMTRDGQANIEVAIRNKDFIPFRQGTKATIRSVGQATLTNRYVSIKLPADGSPPLDGGRSGAVLTQRDTTPIVDLDAILSSIDGPTRKDLRALFTRGSELYAGSGAPRFNAMLAKLNPAVAQVNEFSGELADDRDTLQTLLRSSATATKAVADRSPALESAVRDTAVAFGALADDRRDLVEVLDQAPPVLRQAGGTLRRAASTVSDVRPTLRLVPLPQQQLRKTLRDVPVTLTRLRPAVNRLVRVLPATTRAFDAVPPLEQPLTRAVVDLGRGLKAADPILEGTRYYGTDFLIGVLNGLLGISSGGYNSQGHFAKLSFVQSPQSLLGGSLSNVLPSLRPLVGGLVPNVFNATEAAKARCPGGSAPPAPDGSSPWHPREGLCDPSQDMSALVNSPTATCKDSATCVNDKRDTGFDLPPRKSDDDGGVTAARAKAKEILDKVGTKR